MRCVPFSTSCTRCAGGGERCDKAGQVWHCLKYYNLHQELVSLNFTNHKNFQRVLYQHLKTDVVLKYVYDKDVGALKKSIEEVSKLVQRVAARVKG